jgi:hypothetical protein
MIFLAVMIGARFFVPAHPASALCPQKAPASRRSLFSAQTTR